MSTRKNSKQQQQKSRAELRKQLARDLASILANPECPTGLFNDIADNCTQWQEARDNADETGWKREPFILECFEAYQRQEEKRTKGGTQ
jgi:hypothetical protein